MNPINTALQSTYGNSLADPFGDYAKVKGETTWAYSPLAAAEASAAGQGWAAYTQGLSQQKVAELQRAGELERARIAANAQMAPEAGKNQRFQQVLGLLGGGGGGGLGGLGSSGGGMTGLGNATTGGGGGGRVGIPEGGGGGGGGFGGGGLLGQLFGGPQSAGGEVAPREAIPNQNPWSPERTSREINASRALNQQQVGSQLRTSQNQFGARGFGSLSPQATANASRIRSAGLANEMNQRRQIQNTAAQQGSQYGLQRGGLAEQQATNVGREDIERRKPYYPGQQGGVSMLSSLFNQI